MVLLFQSLPRDDWGLGIFIYEGVIDLTIGRFSVALELLVPQVDRSFMQITLLDGEWCCLVTEGGVLRRYIAIWFWLCCLVAEC